MSRTGRRPGKPRGGPWFGEFKERLSFELRGKRAFPGLVTSSGRGWFTIEVDVDVRGYEPRHLRIVFDRAHVESPAVFADGPTESKHRYSDGALCIWYPFDSPDQRWVRGDGLGPLIGYAARHLFYEAWWRETGHWLGPEAPHGPPAPKPPPREDHRVRDD